MPTSPFLAPGRDERHREGRAKKSGTTYYCVPGVVLYASGDDPQPSAGNDQYAPFRVSTPLIVDQLACEVATLTAGNMRMGIYRADGDWQPTGAPLADSGNISTGTTGVKTYTPSTPLYLPRGRYLTVWTLDSTGAALRGYSGAPTGFGVLDTLGGNFLRGLYVARAYAAFPTPGTAWASVLTSTSAQIRYAVFLRVSTP